jgi:2-amino-4-hydroxy-6-hydroxymethyldihydropteridine diphosphokinase
MQTAFVGLGSNLDDPVRQVETALHELAEIPGTRVTRHSALYRSPPLGPPGQPPYVNAVAELATTLPAAELLTALQQVEQAHGRVRSVRWGPRTLDLDILLYGDLVIDTRELHVPHRELAFRAFVLVPLAEIAPDRVVPGLGPVSRLAAACDATGMAKFTP